MTEPVAGAAWGVIVAAGRSERMAGVDKVYAPLLGRPLIVWSLGAFRGCDDIERVVVVGADEALGRLRGLLDEWRFQNLAVAVPGGARRRDSVLAGVEAAHGAAIVVVHDAARPLVTPELLSTGVSMARKHRAAICAVPSRDAVKEVNGDPPTVRATRERARIWLAQTPQSFDRGVLLSAHHRGSDDADDDAALVEAAGHEVHVYEGTPANLKVTTPEDLIVAEALLRERYRNV